LKLLKDSGYDVVLNSKGRHLDSGELVRIGKDAVGIIAGTEKLDRPVLEKLPRLKVLSRIGIGMDNVDLETSQRLGIRTFNTPSAPVQAVAELTVALMLDLLRLVRWSDHDLRHGIWKKRMGENLKGKKIGIVGFGRIGRRVLELLSPFGVEIAFHDTDEKVKHASIPKITMTELLRWADIVTLHSPATENGSPLLGNKEIKMMKKGSWLVNVARGSLVNEEALISALESGHLKGAALDVFREEPYRGRLTRFDNVILTPHIGSHSRESRCQMELDAVKNLITALRDLKEGSA